MTKQIDQMLNFIQQTLWDTNARKIKQTFGRAFGHSLWSALETVLKNKLKNELSLESNMKDVLEGDFND